MKYGQGFLIVLVASLAAFVRPSFASEDYCRSIPGVELVGDRTSATFLLIGDYHGTTEIPVFFGDLVCNLQSAGETVAVGLEWPQDAAEALERYASDPSLVNRISLLEAISITRSDGRGSAAMMDLVDRLIASDNAARPQFVLFQPATAQPGSAYEEEMARILQQGFDRLRPDRLVVLVGNAHAMKQPIDESDVSPMAAFLPRERTRSFNVEGYFGASWSCRRTGQSSTPDCRVWPLRDGALGLRRIFTTDEPLFDGRYSVGAAFTPSEPANPQSFPDSRLRPQNLPVTPIPGGGTARLTDD